jgi:hypothetical protein
MLPRSETIVLHGVNGRNLKVIKVFHTWATFR